jgi:hypothetical protein
MHAAIIFMMASSITFSGWFGEDIDTLHGVFIDEQNNYSIAFPDSWHSTRNGNNRLLVTRQGWDLQSICVERFLVNDGLPNTKKIISDKMILPDQAQSMIDCIRNSPNLTRFVLQSNKPAMLSGKSAFRIEYSYGEGDLTYQCICYGQVRGEWLYVVQYYAPLRYYFEITLNDFEKSVKTFSILH